MRILEYRIKVRHDKGTSTIITSASSEEAARAKICEAEGCPDSAIYQVRHHAAKWSKLTAAQRTACSLLAYYCFNHFYKFGEAALNIAAVQTAEHACALFEVPYIVIQTIKAGYVKGLPNIAKLSGGTYQNDYDFLMDC